jgi:hypothetical protein
MAANSTGYACARGFVDADESSAFALTPQSVGVDEELCGGNVPQVGDDDDCADDGEEDDADEDDEHEEIDVADAADTDANSSAAGFSKRIHLITIALP